MTGNKNAFIRLPWISPSYRKNDQEIYSKDPEISKSNWNNKWGFKNSWTVTDIEDHKQYYLSHHPEVKKLKTWDK